MILRQDFDPGVITTWTNEGRRLFDSHFFFMTSEHFQVHSRVRGLPDSGCRSPIRRSSLKRNSYSHSGS
eukprot:3906580-Rhodomonas_salina.1